MLFIFFSLGCGSNLAEIKGNVLSLLVIRHFHPNSRHAKFDFCFSTNGGQEGVIHPNNVAIGILGITFQIAAFM